LQKIKNNVIGSEKIEWRKLQWFQGKLKNLSESNLQKLKNSLKKGFISGFKATYLNDQLFILDGHNRQTAMIQLENEGFQFDDLLPVEIIDCNNSKKRAAEILLQINSHYAKITNEGLDEFAAEFDVDLSTINTEFELPDIYLNFDENYDTEFSLPDGDKQPFQQMTFTLADNQAEYIKEKINEIKQTDYYKYCETFGNENSNGNALYAIITRVFNEQG